MNQPHELNPTSNSQESVLNMLPYDHAFLNAELGRSKEFVENYGLDCNASLDAEKERLTCVEAVTGGAVQHSLNLQEKQRGIYTELAEADDCYIALLETKKVTEAEEDEKLGQLEIEKTEQDKLNNQAAQIRAELANYATNTTGYHQSLHEKNSLLGQKFVTSGAHISQLQSEIDGIRIDELPALEARIAKELVNIMRLYASVLTITEQIGSLPAPAADPKNRLLYRNNGGEKFVMPAVVQVVSKANVESITGETMTDRRRKLGVSAVSHSVEEGGRLKRIIVSLRPTNGPSFGA